jgi:hypothetical protein
MAQHLCQRLEKMVGVNIRKLREKGPLSKFNAFVGLQNSGDEDTQNL